MRRLVVITAVLATACTLAPPGAQDPADQGLAEAPDDGEPARLVRVDDGDSLIVEIDGQEQRVRLIGVNAPEAGECQADEARARLDDLLDGQQLLLEADLDSTDRFGRLLRYVFVDGVFINELLVAEGLVLARPFEPNTTRQAVLEAAEDRARQGMLGFWNPTACGAADGQLVVADVVYDPPGLDIEGEYIEIENVGPPVDLTGWTVKDETSQNRYSFPAGLVLDTNQRIRVFTGCGDDTAAVVYWCSSSPVWDNAGDTAFLVAPSGSIQSTYSYGQ